MVRRRRLIKTVGTLGAVGITGTASASDRDKKISATEIGIYEEVAELLRKGKTEEARVLLDKNDVRYVISTNQQGNEQSSSISPADYYNEGNSSVHASLVHVEDDRWLATGVANLRWGTNNWIQGSNVINDGFSLDWDNSHWTSPNRTRENITYGVHKEESVPGNPTIEASIDDYARYGIGGEVDYKGQVEPKYPDFTVNLQTDILRTDPHPEVGVAFRYKHTYAATGIKSSLSFTYGPGVVINVPQLANHWKLSESVDPE
ncbi:hypothetical protein [Haloterrigena salina]|uniref:hypothetical protein n=1 Tax=Haloterrigena salina TaxID=504937 RepID=UPI001267FC65|nr:hypothetical protein [Haloterrigena salina]